ncbi:hypothetical protein BD310DRAFT_945927 [Dichomitus squalens]|uniref:Probable 26S proteasome regulatory subunit p27 n=1 Tax=Dichomitus squalens TaxID=114155 RepID=A0A4Q9Q579_9APHY|nr:hypothetical protein BD310DRAFT_945927 [Dichomitus squalens]
MGFTLPPRMNNNPAAEHVRGLMARKDAIEEEMEAQFSVLQSNGVNMDTPLVDPEGFPRADIDVWAVRHARVKIIELRNDCNALLNNISLALQNVFDPSTLAREQPPQPVSSSLPGTVSEPFAKVDGVAPGSPAASAGLRRDDLVLSFGPLTKASFTSSSLQPLAELVSAQENVMRSGDQRVTLTLTPRRGWGGRGLLGCHIVPYAG